MQTINTASPAFAAAVREARRPRTLEAAGISRRFFDVHAIPGADRLPRALVVLLENVVRRAATDDEAILYAGRIVSAGLAGTQGEEIQFMPARVLFQDFTGVPVFVDFAAMRDAMVARGGDPKKVNPHIPCTLIVDHSVVADQAGEPGCAAHNEGLEAQRNAERFAFLKWASRSFQNVEIVPPGGGICHQLNIERFCKVVTTDALAVASASADVPAASASADVPASASADVPASASADVPAAPSADVPAASAPADTDAGQVACFDTLVGTDSHTTTANGLGVLGWGVGGIEAEAAALGQPISMLVPPVVELRLTGSLGDGISGMDLALTVAQLLRQAGVVGSLVEVTGPGVATLTPTQRACVANMTPEYGSTTTLFPVDGGTVDYLRLTGRAPQDVAFSEAYLRAQGVFADEGAKKTVASAPAPTAEPPASTEPADRTYARTLVLDLSTVRTSLAGPSRPHNHVVPADLKATFEAASVAHGNDDFDQVFCIDLGGHAYDLHHGALAIAAITSCTTATDPAMMVAAGLTAKRAVELGLAAKPWVKRILAPGSHATELLLERAGLTDYLFKLGFYTCGFGCMSCIGNSGEIAPALKALAGSMELTSILSGNRNFDGRISPDVAQNYLAQPALVVAYSLVGTLDVDLSVTPVGHDQEGRPVMLADLLPSSAQIQEALAPVLTPRLFADGARGLFEGSRAWQELQVDAAATFPWDPASTYIRRAPYFEIARRQQVVGVRGARALALLGDFVTTDHISPAGTIVPDAPAASYLRDRGVAQEDFNSYGSRRGNHEVMVRGTFANVKLENLLAQGRRGWWTRDLLDGQVKPLFEAAQAYEAAGVPSVVVAGKMYGSGSSRDWAAKGPLLLGVRAVIAESFERIHRSNLVQMGIVPLEFLPGQTAASLGIRGDETFDVAPIDLSDGLPKSPQVHLVATRPDGTALEFDCRVRIDTPMEGRFVSDGGILPYVLDQMA